MTARPSPGLSASLSVPVSAHARLAARLLLAAGLLLPAAPLLAAGKFCGELTASFGPFDYRRAEFATNLAMVEQAHFTDDVAQGVHGNTGTLGADISYTLHVFPNHTRALESISSITARQKVTQLPGAKYPTECYFDRAIRFAPDDGAVRAAYASFYRTQGQSDKAFAMLSQAVELSPENAAIQYNIGLVYLQRKDYPNALLHAQRAYALGFPLPGLRQKLVAAGQWPEPPK
ncbi:tetratricopeptide repeat protein [Rugamonas sp. CCM 8940]|uniref:tetratricopeptide repeat protein n=1 Tax=Rugamonas sp. CCM 8940 TaxID=2765359 RepID=UPI0018F5ABF1|nr:tetratricopeptide repeat protein [Rugamonas sp. CCM 8940]MBJ7312464.1 tetratricopeptide repeat protein [Rugamonas sp. CCM 8940]